MTGGLKLSIYQFQDIFKHLGDVELLFAKLSCQEWNKLSKTPNVGCDDVLFYGASKNHREICILAKKWGANDWNTMLCGASYNGHRELCELAKKWGEESGTTMDWDYMLWNASGSKELCDLALEWGATKQDDSQEDT
jgi:hypothetical protein